MRFTTRRPFRPDGAGRRPREEAPRSWRGEEKLVVDRPVDGAVEGERVVGDGAGAAGRPPLHVEDMDRLEGAVELERRPHRCEEDGRAAIVERLSGRVEVGEAGRAGAGGLNGSVEYK